jgi:hypothetical protein
LYCVLFGLVGMLLLSPSWVNSIVMHFLCSSMHCLCFLIHQVQLEYHFFNLQTWTLWEILSSLASHCSLEYLFPNFSMNTGLLHTMALFILTPDGYVFPNTIVYSILLISCSPLHYSNFYALPICDLNFIYFKNRYLLDNVSNIITSCWRNQ